MPNPEFLQPSASQSLRAFYRPELDSLRFFAFFVVFMCHVSPKVASWYESSLKVPHSVGVFMANASFAGRFGVYLFFLLSSYLITVLLLREKGQFGHLHVKQFYVRRALRIWPLYYFALIVGCLFYAVAKGQINWHDLPWFVVLLGNWPRAAGQYFALGLDHLWSISVEEQFYLLWPPIVAKLGAFGIKVTAFAAIATPFVVVPIGYLLGWHANPGLFLLNTLFALPAIGAGIYLAAATEGARPRISSSLPRWLLWLVGLGCWYVAASFHLSNETWTILPMLALVPLGSAAILLAVFDAKPQAWLVKLGKVSYGLYVYHMLVIGVFEQVIGRKSISAKTYILFTVLELAITIALAFASYAWLESPFLRLKERFTFIRSRPI